MKRYQRGEGLTAVLCMAAVIILGSLGAFYQIPEGKIAVERTGERYQEVHPSKTNARIISGDGTESTHYRTPGFTKVFICDYQDITVSAAGYDVTYSLHKHRVADVLKHRLASTPTVGGFCQPGAYMVQGVLEVLAHDTLDSYRVESLLRAELEKAEPGSFSKVKLHHAAK